MRIGVLEWASCGGMEGSAELADSIRTEGWAMCRAALISLARGGHQAVAVIDSHCAIDPLVNGYRDDQLELIELSAREPVWNQWQRVYASCDYTLVIAPECGHVLQRVLAWCRRHQIRTCNGCDTFVSCASSKLATATFLERHDLPHPATQPLDSVQHLEHRDVGAALTWVIKPIDGVGCDGIKRVTASELRKFGSAPAEPLNGPLNGPRHEPTEQALNRWIVQPWLAGEAYSRAAIVDRNRRVHWLPVTRQWLSIGERVAYLGGSVEPDLAAAIPGLDELLTRAIHALGGRPLGWVGVDFLYNPLNQQQPVTIIEINPRLTTSFVGLASAGAASLAATIVAAAHGERIELPSQWQSVRFNAAGQCEPA